MASLLGANPADKRILHAFPNMPAFTKEIADSYQFLWDLAGVAVCIGLNGKVPQGTKLVSCP